MTKRNVQFSLLILFTVLVWAVSWTYHYKVYIMTDSVDIHLFPKEVGQWTSKEIKISDSEYAILETKNAFVRVYSHPDGREVMLFIVYSEGNRKVSHPPEICYTGSGITLLEKSQDEIDLMPPIPTMRLVMEQANYQQLAHYWFKVGDTFSRNYWKQQFLIVYKTVMRQPSSSALIRLSAVIDQGGVDKVDMAIKDFGTLITPLLFEYLP